MRFSQKVSGNGSFRPSYTVFGPISNEFFLTEKGGIPPLYRPNLFIKQPRVCVNICAETLICSGAWKRLYLPLGDSNQKEERRSWKREISTEASLHCAWQSKITSREQEISTEAFQICAAFLHCVVSIKKQPKCREERLETIDEKKQ